VAAWVTKLVRPTRTEGASATPTLRGVTIQAVLYVHHLEPLAAFYRVWIGLGPAETGDGYGELRADGLVL
jgi:hypothetical protein